MFRLRSTAPGTNGACIAAVRRAAFAALALALLAGCQTLMPPTERTHSSHTLRQEPHRAAVCIARNIDRLGSGYVARIRQGVEPVLVEIDVHRGRPVALAQLLILGDGSTARIRITPDPPVDHDGLVADMIAGC